MLRGEVSPDRGCVLSWDWLSVSAVWLLPGDQAGGDVGCADGDLLGLRVLLAYVLSVVFGEVGIWVAIPIGWVMADVTGIVYMRRTW